MTEINAAEQLAALDAIKTAIDAHMKALRASLSKEHADTKIETAIGKVSFGARSVKITDEAAFTNWALEEADLELPMAAAIVSKAEDAVIAVLAKHAPHLLTEELDTKSALYELALKLLSIDGDQVLGIDDVPVDFAEVGDPSITLSAGTEKTHARELAHQWVNQRLSVLTTFAAEREAVTA